MKNHSYLVPTPHLLQVIPTQRMLEWDAQVSNISLIHYKLELEPLPQLYAKDEIRSLSDWLIDWLIDWLNHLSIDEHFIWKSAIFFQVFLYQYSNLSLCKNELKVPAVLKRWNKNVNFVYLVSAASHPQWNPVCLIPKSHCALTSLHGISVRYVCMQCFKGMSAQHIVQILNAAY